MSSHFQNRLVGVIVLVALGVIFLPDILDGKTEHQIEHFAEIPLRPEVKKVELPQAEIKSVELSEIESGSNSAPDELDELVHAIEEKEAQESKAASISHKLNKSSVLAYTLQLGSFKSATNVNGLVKQLRNKGFTAYTLPEHPIDGQLTKVFVGPDVSKSKLQALRSDIKKLTKLTGRIVNYDPMAF
ncbi:SPOR domain-containing protein [Shewanella sp. VB17]|uniref:SPOR domain-containing protein n=1 Tax=Shewanella sp. VB17 TaxID=2739432 RepID=UPI001565EA24|nr:SPOR domain-containing protein [Shewanella sp. VB17]NRD74404.1 SPOR domain-containing protein [Shewanella sp. VB17]